MVAIGRSRAVMAWTAPWEYECCGTLRRGDELVTGLWPLGGDRTDPLGDDPLVWYFGHHDDGPARQVRARVAGLWEGHGDDAWVFVDAVEPGPGAEGWVVALDVIEELDP